MTRRTPSSRTASRWWRAGGSSSRGRSTSCEGPRPPASWPDSRTSRNRRKRATSCRLCLAGVEIRSEQLGEAVAIHPRQLELRSVAQDQVALAVGGWPQRLDPGHVDDGGAVHAGEAAGIEPLLELLERPAQEVAAPAAVHLGVVVLRLDPVDFLDGHYPDALAVGDGDALQVPGSIGRCTGHF